MHWPSTISDLLIAPASLRRSPASHAEERSARCAWEEDEQFTSGARVDLSLTTCEIDDTEPARRPFVAGRSSLARLDHLDSEDGMRARRSPVGEGTVDSAVHLSTIESGASLLRSVREVEGQRRVGVHKRRRTSALPMRTSFIPATYLLPLTFSCLSGSALLFTVAMPLKAALAFAPPALKRPKSELEVEAVEEVETETFEAAGRGDSSKS